MVSVCKELPRELQDVLRGVLVAEVVRRRERDRAEVKVVVIARVNIPIRLYVRKSVVQGTGGLVRRGKYDLVTLDAAEVCFRSYTVDRPTRTPPGEIP